MKAQTIYSLLAVLASALFIGGAFVISSDTQPADAQELAGVEVSFFRSPSCGCCAGHAAALEAAGAQVTMNNIDEIALQSMKQEYGIPINKQSCHTAIIDGYVVEGHVPIDALALLLETKPEIQGITLPGMPIGTPGMPGPQTHPFNVETLEGELFWQKNPS